MQNDMLKNTIAPWQEKGRWYHAVLLSDNTFDQGKTDDFILNNYQLDVSATYVRIVQTVASFALKRYEIVDIKNVANCTYSSASTVTASDYVIASGKRYYFIARPFDSGTIEFWFFIV